MKSIKKLPLLPGILIFLSLTLTGCYEDFINIYMEFTPGVYNLSKTEVAFYQFLSAGKPPKGISRFPDGGTHDVLFKNVTLYRYNLETGKLNTVFRFGNIPSNAGSWREKIFWQQNKIAFSLSPLSGWKWMIEHTSNPQYASLYEKYNGILIYNMKTDSTTHIPGNGFEPALSPGESQVAYLKMDSTKIELWNMDLDSGKDQPVIVLSTADEYPPSLYWKDEETIWIIAGKECKLLNVTSGEFTGSQEKLEIDLRKVKQGKIQELTESVLFHEWGLDLSDVWPRKRKEYVRDIVRLHGNLNYRKAILQEIGDDLEVNDIKKILDQMTDYQNSLEGVDKMNYEIFSEETKDLLRKLLEEKT